MGCGFSIVWFSQSAFPIGKPLLLAYAVSLFLFLFSLLLPPPPLRYYLGPHFIIFFFSIKTYVVSGYFFVSFVWRLLFERVRGRVCSFPGT
ncbi:hypothetical protein BC829DRAFT_391381 [Chytridium lagenaria]|nr:hypothetical protein BC829DRAFT_391381 [Chytridium lagenaria]